MNKTLEILITNDDGVQAKGIHTLARLMSRYGNVTVVAPRFGQSGKGTALTMDQPLHFQEVGLEDNVRYYWVDGSPVDCVKMAIFELFSDRFPDLLVSGVNHGSNASAASVYSGTLGACQEGALYEIPSIGFSINSHSPNVDLSAVEHYLPQIMERLLIAREDGYAIDIRPGTYLNINFPKLPVAEIQGIRFARQGKGQWVQEFDKRNDPHGRPYYWMSGLFKNLDEDRTSADHLLVDDAWISIVPHRVDNTDYEALAHYQQSF